MIIEDLSQSPQDIPPMQSLMGLDLGTKTIGVAVSDTFQSVATPLETIKRRQFSKDATRILEIVAERNVGAIVLGMPLIMDGT